MTSSSFQANWQPAGEVYPTGWVLEVIPQGSSFTAGNFLSTTGATGQAEGIALSNSEARSLRIAGVVERVRVPDASHPRGERPTVRLTVDVPRDFALNQPLSPFALAAMDLLNVESPTHALDVVSVIESTLSDPLHILLAQQYQARGEAVAAMKAEGLEYEERL